MIFENRTNEIHALIVEVQEHLFDKPHALEKFRGISFQGFIVFVACSLITSLKGDVIAL